MHECVVDGFKSRVSGAEASEGSLPAVNHEALQRHPINEGCEAESICDLTNPNKVRLVQTWDVFWAALTLGSTP